MIGGSKTMKNTVGGNASSFWNKKLKKIGKCLLFKKNNLYYYLGNSYSSVNTTLNRFLYIK